MLDAASTDAGLVLSPDDLDLIEAARDALRRYHRPFWHTVAAAIRGVDGRIWTGIHLGATVGRLQTCAETVAFGRAVMEGDGTIATIVAVRHPKPEEAEQDLAVVSPCGACRELITDFAPAASVIVPTGAGLRKVGIRVLLPLPYRRPG